MRKRNEWRPHLLFCFSRSRSRRWRTHNWRPWWARAAWSTRITQEPAPSSVAPGGLIWINGLNFGSAADTQVLVNGAEARVLSAGAGRIVAQVPAETAPGLAEVVVQRGSARSRAARILVELVVPSVRALNDGGYGEARGDGLRRDRNPHGERLRAGCDGGGTDRRARWRTAGRD